MLHLQREEKFCLRLLRLNKTGNYTPRLLKMPKIVKNQLLSYIRRNSSIQPRGSSTTFIEVSRALSISGVSHLDQRFSETEGSDANTKKSFFKLSGSPGELYRDPTFLVGVRGMNQ